MEIMQTGGPHPDREKKKASAENLFYIIYTTATVN